ncbi:hypothetical protein DYB37_007696 [Aphanomyces astaci]|uniref:RED-like N-terminal domain-containing protein n=1 Tax=Aphanomyces astaci TaxID=112090 RepID=A0A3R7C9A0_APHAT|nr:hypothetical protein DYB37_007696 [Aphanomyces astaci]
MSLSQSDFRRLLETPRVAPQGGGGGILRRDAAQSKFGGKRAAESSGKGPKDREKYKKFKKPAAGDGDEDDPLKKPPSKMIDPTYQGKYRDRAAERRAGVNQDYEGTSRYQIIDHPSPNDRYYIVIPSGLEDINTEEMDIETSKFLGGDMKHTHLVKGLDLALLAQLKREKEKLQEQHASLVRKDPSSTSSHGPTSTSKSTLPLTALGAFLVKFMTKLTVDPSVKHMSDLFLPGRLHYEFNIHHIDVDTLPRFVQVSPDDCPVVDAAGVHGFLSPQLLEDIQDCFQQPKHAQRRVRQRQGLPPPPTPPLVGIKDAHKGLATIAEDGDDESEDDDIFADVGEYVPPGEEDTVEVVSVPKGSIFQNLSAAQVARDAREKQHEALEASRLAATLAKAKAMYDKGQEMAKADRLREKVAAPDDYDECFPDYEEMEEDGEKKDEKPSSSTERFKRGKSKQHMDKGQDPVQQPTNRRDRRQLRAKE